MPLSLKSIEDALHPPIGAMTWIIGQGQEDGGAYALEAGGRANGGSMRIAFRAPPGLESFATFEAMVEQLLAHAPAHSAQVSVRLRAALERTCPRLFPSDAADPFLHEDAITSAIIRRISRESVYIAPIIDDAARFVCQMLRDLDAPVHLICHDAEHLDRPSARILYRIYRLLGRHDQVAFSLYFGTDPLAPVDGEEPLDRRFAVARRSLFARLDADLRPHIVRPAADLLPQPRRLGGSTIVAGPTIGEPEPPDEVDRPGPPWLQQIARYLIYQNYDRAYVAAAAALQHVRDADTRSNVLRLVGIIDANLGWHNLAIVAIDQSLNVANSPLLEAHLEYLKGLLLTKRQYDLDEAALAYARGLQHIARLDPNNLDVRLEQAWLLNGRALLHTLKAKQAKAEERTELLERAMAEELEAFALVEDNNDAGATYLQHNLLANIAFLLEIRKEFDSALRVWHEAFAPYLNGDGEQRSFEKAYSYRLGILLGRAKRLAEGIAALERAREIAREADDHFMWERIAYGLGYSLHEAGHLHEAAQVFDEGAALALELRDWPAVLDHAKGSIASLAALGRLDEMIAWVTGARRIAEALGHHDLFASIPLDSGQPVFTESQFAALKASLVPPAPKLPAYIPAIDLEATPTRDLNRYLVA